MPDERTPTPRAVLMEFTIDSEAFPADCRGPLVEQIGDAEKKLPETLRILVYVAESEGGPKEVLESVARVPGRFRVPPLSGFGAKDVRPPERLPFVIEDAD